MDGLLFLLFLFWLFKKIAKKGKGKAANRRKEPGAARQTRTDQISERAARMREEIQRVRREKQLSMQDIPAKPIGEGESHMDYTRDAHGCVSEQKEYMGSLRADSSEGEDACDLSLGHERIPELIPESVYAGEIGAEPALDLTPRGIYQGVVMSEILIRPAQRMRRRA